MADRAHILTDKELEEMERHLSAIYARAEKELQEKADAYFKRFEELDAKKRALVDAGKLTEQEYKAWRQNKIMTGKHWTAMKEQTAQELLQVNRTAQEYINGRLPGVYSLNYNSTGEAIQGAVSGYSFELVDASTVKNLATSDKTLLPYKYVDGKKDVRWNTQKVNSEVLQGILQGDSIPHLAKRLQNVTEMNRASAIRNARTTVTSAENKGRIDMLHDAADKGVITHKVWMAAIDARTREAHRLLDGQEQEIDDPFESILGPIKYPGDVDADPANVYQCRCTLTYKVVGFGKKSDFYEPTFNFEGMDAEIAEEHKRAIRSISEEYPLQNTRLESVTDFRTAWGVGEDVDLDDFVDEHSEWRGVGAVFYPKDTHYPGGALLRGAHIVTYDSEEASLTRMSDFLAHLADVREKDGWHGKSDSFFNATGGIESMIVHEYGHALAFDRGFYYGGARYSELQAIFSKYTQEEIGRYISIYASTNPQEMFAEAFVLSHEPRLRNKLIDELMGLL